MNFANHWDANVTHDGFTGFSQRRYPVRMQDFGLIRQVSSLRLCIRMGPSPIALPTPARRSIPWGIHVLEVPTTMWAFMNVSKTLQHIYLDLINIASIIVGV
jgi:hypothetical protein